MWGPIPPLVEPKMELSLLLHAWAMYQELQESGRLGTLSQSVVVGFMAEPFRQMIYLEPLSITARGKEGLGMPGTGQRVTCPII